jgi:glutathione S-transferase
LRKPATVSSFHGSISPPISKTARNISALIRTRVPALTDGNWVLTEAPAILRYIAARHPAAGLWPWDPQEEARCAEWLNWLSSTIQPAFVHVRRAARYASDPRAIEDVASTGKKNAHELWRKVDEKIGEGPWALGERYSVADRCLLFIGFGAAARCSALT